jgi:amino acid permease
MWGMSFYMYEGIGCVLPVMEASDYKDNFTWLLIGGLTLLLCIHIYFSELCYYTYGENLNEPILIEQLPQDNWFLIIGRLLFCVNIVVSFPLLIYITNHILESYTFSRMKYSTLRTWLKNLSRTVVTTISFLIAFYCYKQLHKIISFVGVFVGSFIVLVTPALVHYKLVASTPYQRGYNIAIVVYALGFAIGLGTMILVTWNKH